MRFLLLTQWLVLMSLVMSAPLLRGEWQKASIPFDATAISRSADKLWVCGPNASIASSSDGGAHWDIRNIKTNAGTLLSIGWASNKLGFAGGMNGLLLLSVDGGTIWQQVLTSFAEPILDLSFATRSMASS